MYATDLPASTPKAATTKTHGDANVAVAGYVEGLREDGDRLDTWGEMPLGERTLEPTTSWVRCTRVG